MLKGKESITSTMFNNTTNIHIKMTIGESSSA